MIPQVDRKIEIGILRSLVVGSDPLATSKTAVCVWKSGNIPYWYLLVFRQLRFDTQDARGKKTVPVPFVIYSLLPSRGLGSADRGERARGFETTALDSCKKQLGWRQDGLKVMRVP